MMVKPTINSRIRQLRNSEAVTQNNFAKMLGISRNYVAELETGKGSPSEQLILNMCRTFQVNYDWLKHNKGKMHDQELKITAKGRMIIDEVSKVVASTDGPYSIGTSAEIFGINPDHIGKPLSFDFQALRHAILILVQIFEENNKEKIDAVMSQLKVINPGPVLYHQEKRKR